MALAQQVEDDLMRAFKGRDSTTTATLRLVKAAAKNAEVAKRAPLTEDEYLDVIVRQAKLRREAAAEYDRGGRPDRAEQERAELSILQQYLPQQLGESELRRIVQDTISEVGAAGPGDLGKVMSRVMASVRGTADGAQVNQLTRELLSRAAE